MVSIRKRFNRPLFLYFYLVCLLAGPLILVVLPADFFDQGPPMCLSVILFDQTCYGCGMTRALMHLLHLQIETAAMYNKLVFIVLPLLLIVWAQELFKIRKKIRVLG
jgi:hypothetical protein